MARFRLIYVMFGFRKFEEKCEKKELEKKSEKKIKSKRK